MTPEFVRFLRARETSDEMICLMELSHVEWNAVERIARWGAPILHAGDVYEPVGFDLGFPDETQDDNPGLQVTIANTDRRLVDRMLVRAGYISAKVIFVLHSDVETPQIRPMFLRIASYSITRDAIQATMTFEPILDEAATHITFDEVHFPGLR